jgi:hypothetical protein
VIHALVTTGSAMGSAANLQTPPSPIRVRFMSGVFAKQIKALHRDPDGCGLLE